VPGAERRGTARADLPVGEEDIYDPARKILGIGIHWNGVADFRVAGRPEETSSADPRVVASDVWTSSAPYTWRTVAETFSEFVAELRFDGADAEPAAG
jgi:hypothetical protein